MTREIAIAELEGFGRALLAAAGVALEPARQAQAVLTYADQRGLSTHGHGALATIYLPRLLDGRINSAARTRVIGEHGACVVLDAEDGLGLAAMTQAVDRAVELARTYGVGAATVRRSSHFGAAGYYAWRVARQGLVAIVMTNCGDQRVVPPLGGSERLFGTNPLGIGVPADGSPDLVLDMSTTTVAAGKVNAAARERRSIPAGWLIGADDAPIKDPEAYRDGRADLSWLGGGLTGGAAKGFGLGLFVELLCGPLAGAGYGPRGGSEPIWGGDRDDRDIGHVAFVLDPRAFHGGERFSTLTGEVLATVGNSPSRGSDPVRYPGQPEAQHAAKAEATGRVVIADHFVKPLADVAARVGVTVPDALLGSERVLA